jgi:capsular exopolysaccharide synthesis family protein
MTQLHNINVQEDNELEKIIEQISKKYYLFIIGVVFALAIAFVINRYSIPIYKVSASILIKEDNNQQKNVDDFLNNNLFGSKKRLQNELQILKSSKVIRETIKNLDLSVTYYRKRGFQYLDAYKDVPFKVLYPRNHVQPINAIFEISFQKADAFQIKSTSKKVAFYNFENNKFKGEKEDWSFRQNGKVGKLIESPDLNFFIEVDSSKLILLKDLSTYYFEFSTIPTSTLAIKSQVEFNIVDKDATVLEVALKTTSYEKGVDMVNELLDVYATQNLEKKNHLASITIDYIDKQLAEITDSLSQVEQNLQSFRSNNQLLNVAEQSTGITSQYRDLQNQKAELVTRKRYYEYVSDYLSKNEDFTNIIVPASLGIPDQLLNNMMSELITSQAQRSNMIESSQEKNPLVKKLTIQIENLKKTIKENITSAIKTSEISLDEMNKRIWRVEAEISRLPKTQRQLGSIERKYRLNDAIYNYLLEKRAEANITKASNLPDNEIIESAEGSPSPVSPNKKLNYMVAVILGLIVPFSYIRTRSALNKRIESQDSIERLTDFPVLGKILHNNKKTNNIMFEYPDSNIAESFRALRTNLEYYIRGGHKKVIMVTSCVEEEGKSFNSLNIAMSYAQLNRRTILLDFDLRKSSTYFNKSSESIIGLSSYLINKATLDDIIIPSPHINLDYIPSGPIPPNPAELIALERTEKLITRLKETYDYIIIDTPPLAQVADAYLMIDYADLKVLVTRYNFTLKKVFSLTIKDIKQKNINHMCILLNDNRIFADQYGYGYGYKKTSSKKK